MKTLIILKTEPDDKTKALVPASEGPDLTGHSKALPRPPPIFLRGLRTGSSLHARDFAPRVPFRMTGRGAAGSFLHAPGSRGPGELAAYTRGLAVELMDTSDEPG